MRTTYALVGLLALAACGSTKSGDKKTDPVKNPNDTTGGGGDTSTFTGPQMKYYGHNGSAGTGTTIFAWSGSGVEVRASGTLAINMSNASGSQANHMQVLVDGQATEDIVLVDGTTSYPITLPDDKVHTVQVIKRTEAGDGSVYFRGFTGTLEANTKASSGRYIEFIGDSITAGYGNLATTTSCGAIPGSFAADPNYEDVTQGFAIQAAMAVDAEWAIEAWSGKGLKVNGDGTTTDTMATLWKRTDPTNSSSTYTPDPNKTPSVVVVNLGTNDFTKVNYNAGRTTSAAFTAAYLAMVADIRATYPEAIILIAVGPMLSNTTAFTIDSTFQLPVAKAAISAAVSQSNDAKVQLIEFVPNGTTDYGCDYHPNVAKSTAMAASLADVLRIQVGWTNN